MKSKQKIKKFIAAFLCLGLLASVVPINEMLATTNIGEGTEINLDNTVSGGDAVTETTEPPEETNIADESDEWQYRINPFTTYSNAVYSVDAIAPQGYHYYVNESGETELSANIYFFYYDPNNGNTEYEKDINGYTSNNSLYSAFIYNNDSPFEGRPVASFSHPENHHAQNKIMIDESVSSPLFERTNYNFTGWNTEPDGTGKQFQPRDTIYNEIDDNYGSLTLYAQWEIARTRLDIDYGTGHFSIDKFAEINGLSLLTNYQQEGKEVYEYALPDGRKIIVKDSNGLIEIDSECLVTLNIPEVTSDLNTTFVGYTCISKNWNPEGKTIFLEGKESHPTIKANYMSELSINGTIDLNGYDNEGSVYLVWGQKKDDDIDKVYKIAQSLDGTNFEYIPDQNLTELIKGKEYGYTGSVQKFTAPVAGKYKLDAYGANAGVGYGAEGTHWEFGTNKGSSTVNRSGYGAHTSGYINLEKGQTIYIYVGEAGGAATPINSTKRTYGGGGATCRTEDIFEPLTCGTGRGGGATYVSLVEKSLDQYLPENWEKTYKTSVNEHLTDAVQQEKDAANAAKNDVLMVAAGGSARGEFGNGADGGSLTGESTEVIGYEAGTTNVLQTVGATQTAPGNGNPSGYGLINGVFLNTKTTSRGTFFFGADGLSCSGAAGGGWFGGGICYTCGGSGSSSYIGEQAGLYDGVAEAGGNIENISDQSMPYDVHGKVIIKCEEYWITTNTAENVYSPDKAAPNTPELVYEFTENKKATVSWDNVDDNYTSYWYRADAFKAENHSEKISETEVKEFDILSGTKGYYWLVDDQTTTTAHHNNGNFTEEPIIRDLEVLDIGMPQYLHVSAVDNAGNISSTATILLNKSTVVIDPNVNGTYGGTKEKTEIILNYGETYTLTNIVPDEGYRLNKYKKTTGDGVFDSNNGTVTAGYSKTTLVAQWIAPLVLSSKPNYTAYNKKGTVDLSWYENDEIDKKYKLLQSEDKTNWYDAAISNGTASTIINKTFNAGTKAYETYVVPYTGSYTLTVSGSKGGSYGSYSGGNGSTISGEFLLKKGDILYVYLGKPGTNGAGSGTYAAGGGATDIRLNGTALSNRILVAAGGSGANYDKNGVAESTSQTNNPGTGNNSVLGVGSSGASGGGSGYYGGNVGTYTTSQQRLTDYIGKRQGRYMVYGFAWYSNGACPYSYKATAGSKIRYNGIEWNAYSVNSDTGVIEGDIISWFTFNYGTATTQTNTVGALYYPGAKGFCISCENFNVDWGGPMYHPDCNGHWDGFRTISSSTASQAGTSYINSNIGTLISLNRGNYSYTAGKATISANIVPVGETNKNSMDGIIAVDTAAPNAPFSGRIVSNNGSSAVVSWAEPDDNGTVYYHMAKSYDKSSGQLLNDSNITEDNIVTGVAGYRYFSDTNPGSIVNYNNSSYVNTNQISIASSKLTNYIHVAAVDAAGNIGPTYTFQPIAADNVPVKVIWIDDDNANGTRPKNNVKVTLMINGSEYKSTEPDKQDVYNQNSTVSFDGIPRGSGNNVYTAVISGVESLDDYYYYETSYEDNGLTIINRLVQSKRDINVNIKWDDNNNSLGTRPDEIDVILKDADGNVVKRQKVSKNKFNVSFVGVPSGKQYFIDINGATSKIPEDKYNANVGNINDNDTADVIIELEYNLIIDPNGGEWNGSKETQDILKHSGDKVNIPDPVLDGYVFKGWEVTGDTSVKDHELIMPKDNVKLVAKWEPVGVILTVKPNGGIYNNKTEDTIHNMSYGESMLIQPAVRNGYVFVGWELDGYDANIINMYYNKSLFTIGKNNAVLTAEWVPIGIMVTLDPNGGTVPDTKLEVTYDQPYGEIPDPVRPGYDFIGWKTDDNEIITEESIVKIPYDHTLTAEWKVKQTGIKGKIVWVDNNNEHGARPDALDINILSDGEFITWNDVSKFDGTTVKSGKDDWTFEANPLQKYNITEGKDIVYSVKLKEEHFKTKDIHYQYSSEYSYDSVNDLFVITLTEYRATKTISGNVVWVDSSNKFGSRPENVTVDLYQDGTKIDSRIVSGDSDTWAFSFEDKLIYRDDYSEYEYTVNVNPNPTESLNNDDCYKTTIESFTITEKLDNSNKKVIGTIKWVDDNDKYNYRPEKVTIILYADGVEVKRIEVDSSENTFEFDSLPKYVIEDNEYRLVDYQIKEIVNDWYEINIDKVPVENGSGIEDNHRFDITNTFHPTEKDLNTNARAKLEIKAVYDDADIKNLAISSNPVFSVRLVEMTKVFTNSGEPGKYELSYENIPTGEEINLCVGKDYITTQDVVSGKYLIDVTDGYSLHFVEAVSKYSDNAEIVIEDGKYYVIFDQTNDYSAIKTDVVMDGDWSGYKKDFSINNYFKN